MSLILNKFSVEVKVRSSLLANKFEGDNIMFRKLISFIALVAMSCSMLFCTSMNKVSEKGNKQIRVKWLKKLSGEEIKFYRNKGWGKVIGDSVEGSIIVHKEVVFERDYIESIKRSADGSITEIVTRDDWIYRVEDYREEVDKIMVTAKVYENVSIPLSDVKQWTIGYDRTRKTAKIIMPILLGVGFGVVIYVKIWDSIFGDW